MNNINIFIWSWNTQSIDYSTNNNFIIEFKNKISKLQYIPDLIVIGLQEDSIQSKLIQDISINLKDNYDLIEENAMYGWGITTLKKLKNNYEYCLRGLHIAVFMYKNTQLEIYSIKMDKIRCLGLQNYITLGKGAIVVNIDTNIGKLSFVNIHLPFSSKSIYNGFRYKDVIWQSKCLNDIYLQVVNKFGKNMFLFGDFNFRIQLLENQTAQEIAEKMLMFNIDYYKELFEQADELKLLKYYYMDSWGSLIEGINNEGPLFLPTCKLKHYREQEYNLDIFKLGSKNQRIPSWCDRILFSNNIECLYYNRWDYKDMNKSDHASVVGFYTLAGFDK
jgi:hypothetical protein